MSQIIPALQLLRNDLEKAKPQWRNGEMLESLLQREDMNMQELCDLFDPEPDENDWLIEDATAGEEPKLRLYRRRMAFLKASRKEFHEEYDENVTDVDFMRLLELPFTDPKYTIEFSMEEMN